MAETPIKTIDLKGMKCPLPVIKVARAIREVTVGQTVEVFATDPAIQADIPAWCRTTGHELVMFENQDKLFHFIVRRSK
jgi:tRNA 2-thiouridine synthesizing protein A